MELYLDAIALHVQALFNSKASNQITSHEATLDSIFQDSPTRTIEALSLILKDSISWKEQSIFIVSLIRKLVTKLTKEKENEQRTLQIHQANTIIYDLANLILNPELCQAAFTTLWETIMMLVPTIQSSLIPSFVIQFISRAKSVLNELVEDVKYESNSKKPRLEIDPHNFHRMLRFQLIIERMIALTSETELYSVDQEPLEKLMIESFDLIIFLGKELIEEYKTVMPIYSRTSTLKADSPHVNQILQFTLQWVTGVLNFLQNLERSSALFTGVRQYFISNYDLVDIFMSLVAFDNSMPIKREMLFESSPPKRHLITKSYKDRVNEILNLIRLKSLQVISLLLLIDQEIEPADQEQQPEDQQSALHQTLPQMGKLLIEGLFNYFVSVDIANKEEREDQVEHRLFYLNSDQSPIIYDIVLHSVTIISTWMRMKAPNLIESFDLYRRLAVGVLLPLFVTTPKEREIMLLDPSQFSFMCEDVCNDQHSMNLKSQAAKLLENYVDNCYEMKHFVLTFTLELFQNSLSESKLQSFTTLTKYKDYPIVAVLPSKIQLDITLMVFSILGYLFEEMPPVLKQLDFIVTDHIDELINHPFLVIKLKLLLFFQSMFDLLFQNSKSAQTKAIKFILACYTQQTDTKDKDESDLIQIMGINCFHQVLNCQKNVSQSLAPHMLLIFEGMLHNIEQCEIITFFQHLDEHLVSQAPALLDTKISDISDSDSDTSLLMEILHSYAVRLANDKGECFDRVLSSFKFFFTEPKFASMWAKQDVIDQIEPWGEHVFSMPYNEVPQDVMLTLALALGRCNKANAKLIPQSLEFLGYFVTYLSHNIKEVKDVKQGILKYQGMVYIQSLCQSPKYILEIDSKYQKEGGFVSIIIFQLGFDLMSIEGVRPFEEGVTVLLDVIMTEGANIDESFFAKMLDFFAKGKDNVKNEDCSKLISYCYLASALFHGSICLQFFSKNPAIFNEFTNIALSDKETLHQHGLCTIGISFLLRSKGIAEMFEISKLVRLLVAMIKSMKEMKRMLKQKTEDNQEPEEENKEQEKTQTEKLLDQEDGAFQIVGYFKNSQTYSKEFNHEEALACFKQGVEGLIVEVKRDELYKALGKSNLQDMDDLMYSQSVNKQVRRVFKATRNMVNKKSMKVIDEMAKLE